MNVWKKKQKVSQKLDEKICSILQIICETSLLNSSNEKNTFSIQTSNQRCVKNYWMKRLKSSESWDFFHFFSLSTPFHFHLTPSPFPFPLHILCLIFSFRCPLSYFPSPLYPLVLGHFLFPFPTDFYPFFFFQSHSKQITPCMSRY